MGKTALNRGFTLAETPLARLIARDRCVAADWHSATSVPGPTFLNSHLITLTRMR